MSVPAALPVLMYHSISELPDSPLRSLAVPGRLLYEQLSALSDVGYRLVGLSEALARRKRDPGEPVVAVTFDDGFVDFLSAGLPVLSTVGAGATLYPAVAHIGRFASWLGSAAEAFGPLLTMVQLREVVAVGVEIGSHAWVHHPLDVLPLRRVAHEVRAARELLRQELQVPVPSLAYPHGYHSAGVRAVVAAAGHDSACEVGRRLYRGGDRLAISRLFVTPDHSGADVVRLVRTGGPPLSPLIKDLARPAWRATRWGARKLLGRRLT